MQVPSAYKQSFESLARQYPELGEYLRKWRQAELEKLPFATQPNLDVLRGRVQSLTEIREVLFGRGDTP